MWHHDVTFCNLTCLFRISLACIDKQSPDPVREKPHLTFTEHQTKDVCLSVCPFVFLNKVCSEWKLIVEEPEVVSTGHMNLTFYAFRQKLMQNNVRRRACACESRWNWRHPHWRRHVLRSRRTFRRSGHFFTNVFVLHPRKRQNATRMKRARDFISPVVLHPRDCSAVVEVSLKVELGQVNVWLVHHPNFISQKNKTVKTASPPAHCPPPVSVAIYQQGAGLQGTPVFVGDDSCCDYRNTSSGISVERRNLSRDETRITRIAWIVKENQNYQRKHQTS